MTTGIQGLNNMSVQLVKFENLENRRDNREVPPTTYDSKVYAWIPQLTSCTKKN